jgi:hypothetical protein
MALRLGRIVGPLGLAAPLRAHTDSQNNIVNAERRGKRQVLIRPSSKVVVKFLSVMQKHGECGDRYKGGRTCCTEVEQTRRGIVTGEKEPSARVGGSALAGTAIWLADTIGEDAPSIASMAAAPQPPTRSITAPRLRLRHSRVALSLREIMPLLCAAHSS